MMTLHKQLALRIPAIKRLYDQRDDLMASNTYLTQQLLQTNLDQATPQPQEKNDNVASVLTNEWHGTKSTEVPESPHLAFICSHGRTGNRWIGRVLNNHPDIACGIGPITIPVLEKDDTGWDRSIPHEKPHHAASHKKFYSLTLDEMRDTLENLWPGKRFYIRGHSITSTMLFQKLRSEKCKYRISGVNVIRHPITRIPSYQWEWDKTIGILHDQLTEIWDTQPQYRIYEDLVKTHFPHVDINERSNRYFIIGMFWVLNDLGDFTVPIRQYRYEDIVGHPEALYGFLRFLLGRDFNITPDYIANAFAQNPANKSGSPKAAVQTYANWEPWQKYCFRRFMDDHNIDKIFQQYDYDFSFVK